ncbi:MAG: hypothetical protein ACRDZ7_03840 [Acidimicrobiia bacterium]
MKNPSRATVASVRNATGTAILPDTNLTSAGSYTAVITNNSPKVPVPSYTLTITAPRQRTGSITLQLKDGAGVVVATAPAGKPAPSVVTAWSQHSRDCPDAPTPSGRVTSKSADQRAFAGLDRTGRTAPV